jgi:hypothetical protein
MLPVGEIFFLSTKEINLLLEVEYTTGAKAQILAH